LGIDDAMKYKDFKMLDKAITSHVDTDYNKFCFYRWMAMAALDRDGGFMSDNDTFPLPSSRPFSSPDKLPHRGIFTVYDAAPEGGIPSLMSGSKTEWNRMVKAITKSILDPRSNGNYITSDMLSLMELDRNDDSQFYNIDQKIVTGINAVGPNVEWEDKCSKYRGFFAVHFAHVTIKQGIKRGVYPNTAMPKDRAPLVTDLMAEWASKCGVYEHIMDSY